jgi:hypothetical protein
LDYRTILDAITNGDGDDDHHGARARRRHRLPPLHHPKTLPCAYSLRRAGIRRRDRTHRPDDARVHDSANRDAIRNADLSP